MPDGSVLGPILFLIYINDLSTCSNLDTALYADDTVLTLLHNDVNCLQANLDYELPKIEFWLKRGCSQPLPFGVAEYIYFFLGGG